jgi:hypothetical protein
MRTKLTSAGLDLSESPSVPPQNRNRLLKFSEALVPLKSRKSIRNKKKRKVIHFDERVASTTANSELDNYESVLM